MTSALREGPPRRVPWSGKEIFTGKGKTRREMLSAWGILQPQRELSSGVLFAWPQEVGTRCVTGCDGKNCFFPPTPTIPCHQVPRAPRLGVYRESPGEWSKMRSRDTPLLGMIPEVRRQVPACPRPGPPQHPDPQCLRSRSPRVGSAQARSSVAPAGMSPALSRNSDRQGRGPVLRWGPPFSMEANPSITLLSSQHRRARGTRCHSPDWQGRSQPSLRN